MNKTERLVQAIQAFPNGNASYDTSRIVNLLDGTCLPDEVTQRENTIQLHWKIGDKFLLCEFDGEGNMLMISPTLVHDARAIEAVVREMRK